MDVSPTDHGTFVTSAGGGSGFREQAPKGDWSREEREIGSELTGDAIRAVEHFPDQNPNPVLRVDDDGRLLYANPASSPITQTWGIRVGDRVPEAWRKTLEGVANTDRRADLTCGSRTYELLAVGIPDLAFMNVYGTDVTASRLVDKFPSLNPHAVLRISEQGVIRYANAASVELLWAIGSADGDALPPDLCDRIFTTLETGTDKPVEVEREGRAFALRPVRIPELGLINVYGTEVTAEKAIVKFPDQNPNPVFRIRPDGLLIYTNPASASLMDGLGARIGEPLPDVARGSVLESAAQGRRRLVEVASNGRQYALLPVNVPEFGFINVYGTDVTAVRELEIAHRENERLLLNILPPPIAARLREGETLIADRFDDVTLLFADIVDFTRLSTRLGPDQLVSLLNRIFTIFDRHVEAFGVEKVKTIGDAYMVVGGLSERSPDHTDRVARLALQVMADLAQDEGVIEQGIEFRVGIHCGPVVAGVIGTKKFIYDIWGDTVNLASRMESHGAAGRIHVSGAVEERLRGRFSFEPRGPIVIKGRGPLPTWFLKEEGADRARSRSVGDAPEAGAAARPRS